MSGLGNPLQPDHISTVYLATGSGNPPPPGRISTVTRPQAQVQYLELDEHDPQMVSSLFNDAIYCYRALL